MATETECRIDDDSLRSLWYRGVYIYHRPKKYGIMERGRHVKYVLRILVQLSLFYDFVKVKYTVIWRNY